MLDTFDFSLPITHLPSEYSYQLSKLLLVITIFTLHYKFASPLSFALFFVCCTLARTVSVLLNTSKYG